MVEAALSAPHEGGGGGRPEGGAVGVIVVAAGGAAAAEAAAAGLPRRREARALDRVRRRRSSGLLGEVRVVARACPLAHGPPRAPPRTLPRVAAAAVAEAAEAPVRHRQLPCGPHHHHGRRRRALLRWWLLAACRAGGGCCRLPAHIYFIVVGVVVWFARALMVSLSVRDGRPRASGAHDGLKLRGELCYKGHFAIFYVNFLRFSLDFL